MEEKNMRTSVKLFASAAAVVAVVGFSSIQASAFMGDEGMGMPPAGRQFKKMAAELGLTAQQQEGAKGIFAKNRPATEPLMKQLKSERHVLKNLVQADTIDEAAIRAQVAKMGTLQADMAVQHAKLAQEVRTILSPEQIQKFKEIQAARESRKDMGRKQGDRKHPAQDN
jgi:protein CpxP